MNSDTWLPTAPVRVTLRKPPGSTASALRTHGNQVHIKAARTEYLGRSALAECSESLLVSRAVFAGDSAGSNPTVVVLTHNPEIISPPLGCRAILLGQSFVPQGEQRVDPRRLQSGT